LGRREPGRLGARFHAHAGRDSGARAICPIYGAPPVETLEEDIAKLFRAIEEARRRKPAALSGRTYPVERGGRTLPMDRVHVEAALQNVCPRGLPYLYHYLNVILVNADDFEAACGHFGLSGVLQDIANEEVDAEARARRERGAEPSTGMLPAFLDERYSREEADARIAIVKRRIAEARASAPKIPAPAPAAQRGYPAATLP